MRTSWNDEEEAALQGLPLRAQIVYLRGIRRYMDYGSIICGGPQRRISLDMLAEIVQEWVNRQVQPRATKDGIRASIEQLKRAGLLERLPDPDYLLFYLPLADADKSALQNYPITAAQPGASYNLSEQATAERALPVNQSTTGMVNTSDHQPTHQEPDSVVTLPNGRAADARKPAPPYQAIVDLYHECLPALPRVYKLTDARRRRLRVLWDDELDDLQSWRNYFMHVSRADFLMGRCLGRDGAVFLASFDFIIHPAKFIKIAEEQYHVKKVQARAANTARG